MEFCLCGIDVSMHSIGANRIQGVNCTTARLYLVAVYKLYIILKGASYFLYVGMTCFFLFFFSIGC